MSHVAGDRVNVLNPSDWIQSRDVGDEVEKRCM